MFFGHARTGGGGGGGGGFPWSCGFMCVLALLPVWYYDMELTPLSSVLLLLSVDSRAVGVPESTKFVS